MPEQVTKKLISWASEVDGKTLAQMSMTAQMPFIYPHIALMPDAHLGLGCAVGSVLPTQGAIMPAAVGVDIGCGMIAVRTQFTTDDLIGRDLSTLRIAIENAVPLSPGNYNSKLWTPGTEERIADLEASASGFTPDQFAANWRLQLGSLGGGNHFIEVTVDEEQRIWLFLHSGSRGVGNKIAQFHIKVAQKQCRDRFITLPSPDLAYLVEGDEEFWNYMNGLRWAQKFALLNREEMMDRVIRCFEEWVDWPVAEAERINCHHNYTERAVVRGEGVWLSRKGAIDATKGKPGLIPGSMGTASYVVEGKGNELALNSSPHGAGRRFSRSAAKKEFSLEDLQERMKGIEWSGSEAFIDEIPDAYKDIDVVMNDSKDLVEVKHIFSQILNVKGT